MSDLRTILTGRTDNTVTVIYNRPTTEPAEPKVVRIQHVVDLDTDLAALLLSIRTVTIGPMGGKNSHPDAICSLPRSHFLAELRGMDRDELRSQLLHFTHQVTRQRRNKKRIDPFDRDMVEMIEQRLAELDSD